MFSLSIYHPDIEEFINRKTEFIKDKDLYGETYRPKYLEHANISVEIDNKFIQAVKEDKEIELIDPHTKEVKKKVKAKKLWDKLIYNNWKTADPGILNFDILNEFNPLKGINDINSVNP
jgi:ribonucleoside-diphosphate reductase alpha chain